MSYTTQLSGSTFHSGELYNTTEWWYFHSCELNNITERWYFHSRELYNTTELTHELSDVRNLWCFGNIVWGITRVYFQVNNGVLYFLDYVEDTNAESGAYSRDSSQCPQRCPYIFTTIHHRVSHDFTSSIESLVYTVQYHMLCFKTYRGTMYYCCTL